MSNELGLKPNTTRRLSRKAYRNLGELLAVLDGFVSITNQHPSVIDVDADYEAEHVGFATLEAECLTDGSIVYNVLIA